MRRADLIAKLRALAADPAATPNERAVAAAKADQLEQSAPSEPQARAEWEAGEFTRAEWDALPDPVPHGWGFDLGPYSPANLHRALYMRPDGSMRCHCHGPVRLDLVGSTLRLVHYQ